jgi:hypothetical protein
MDFSVVLAASAAVNRFVEFVKPRIRALKYSVDVQDSILVLIQVLAGIAVALMGNLNLFTGIATLPTVFATVLTGVVVGLGSDVINVVIDLLYGWKNNVTSTQSAESASADISIDVKGTSS